MFTSLSISFIIYLLIYLLTALLVGDAYLLIYFLDYLLIYIPTHLLTSLLVGDVWLSLCIVCWSRSVSLSVLVLWDVYVCMVAREDMYLYVWLPVGICVYL